MAGISSQKLVAQLEKSFETSTRAQSFLFQCVQCTVCLGDCSNICSFLLVIWSQTEGSRFHGTPSKVQLHLSVSHEETSFLVSYISYQFKVNCHRSGIQNYVWSRSLSYSTCRNVFLEHRFKKPWVSVEETSLESSENTNY